MGDRLFLVRINPIALRKTKIVYNFGLSECNRVNTLTPLEVFPLTKRLKKSVIFIMTSVFVLSEYIIVHFRLCMEEEYLEEQKKG